ncbi:NADH dehydrogenase subunit E [Nitratireductor indicus C115]|uniref:NADH dehydrogenase subunit E n=1 Tax=Nitratireductor indicus C115 TaxID=1231190 RepID=K2PNQ5_9HYPH|nr:NADH-quinone oxidoreductase subunit E [Nitratireductor indicus]EKF42687.1 NADH dehydrogenase subunit E [Nitratireductor indicus C115]SFQ38827.1 NADH-quinone oxidoreductase subunit E [Nitratireductor indicus]
MSVRRLADEAVQPASFAFSRSMSGEVKRWIKKYPKGREQSAVIPLLMLAQEQEGWVTRAAIEHVANMLNMPLIRVLEVATFYTQFQLAPVGTRAHVQVCGTTPCMLRGAGELIDLCKSKIHPEPFHLNEGGTLSWEEVECQGACVNAPMVMIFKDSYEDLTPERLSEIIDAFEAGKGDTVKPGPQIDRIYSAPKGGLTALTDEKAVTGKGRGKAAGTARASAAKVPPSNAAKPKTDAIETAKAVASPSPVKTDEAAARKAPARKTHAKSAPAVAKASPAKAAAAKAAKPSLEDKNRPQGIARPVTPDDLKMISGVGPKIEGILHDLGIFTFAQVAAWKKAEREWVDGYLSFHGRIEREDWVKQAKALAKGGEAEYIKVFGKKPR